MCCSLRVYLARKTLGDDDDYDEDDDAGILGDPQGCSGLRYDDDHYDEDDDIGILGNSQG